MKESFIHRPAFRLISPIVCGVLIYLLILLINNNVEQLNALFSSQEVYFCIGLSLISFEVVRLSLVAGARILKGEDFTASSIVIQTLASTLLALGANSICISLYYKYAIGFQVSTGELTIFTILFTVLTVLYNIIYLSNRFLTQENSLKLNIEKLQKEILDTEISNFKNNINPDLLYDSLENLIALMYRDVEKAEDYIDCLASCYRYILTHRSDEVVSVEDEISAGKNMIRLLNEKYQGRIQLEINLDDVSDGMLIPGSLPLIFETIVRNSIVTGFEDFVIRCYQEDDYITIQTRLNDKLIAHPASEFAFVKLQKSYTRFTDLPLIKVKAYQENFVKLPVIKLLEELN
jgi:sensor histidine kinase YesM